MTGYRIGVDVGGTFTDLICVTPDGTVVLDKTPSTLDDQSSGVMQGITQLAERFGFSLAEFCNELDIVVHGTTTGDNTMIEMNGAPTGLLVTDGHRDEIELRRCHKEEIWDPSAPGPQPIARRRQRIPIPQRTNFEGATLLALDEDAVRRGVHRLKALGVRSIAVMYLFSFVNPTDELRTREIILEEYPDVESITLSHEVMPRGPEFERVSTTLVNAYLAPKLARYIGNLQDKLRSAGFGGPLLIMQSTGGVMPPDYVARRAVSVLASGPTGGVMGATVAARHARIDDFVAVDMGGTSYDLCLVRHGEPEIKTDWNWRYRYYIGMPMVDVQSVGAGGGSIARVRQGAPGPCRRFAGCSSRNPAGPRRGRTPGSQGALARRHAGHPSVRCHGSAKRARQRLEAALDHVVRATGLQHVHVQRHARGVAEPAHELLHQVRLEAAGIGVTGDVEPVASPALAVLRRCEQVTDQLGKISATGGPLLFCRG